MSIEKKLWKVQNDDFVFSYSEEDLKNANVVETEPGLYHVLKDNSSKSIRIISASGSNIRVEADGERYDIIIKNEFQQMLEALGFNNTQAAQVKEIKAPMPGLVLQISVTEAATVSPGDKLIILEAMKMENSILAPAEAKVKKIHVTTGMSVEKGQLLIEFE